LAPGTFVGLVPWLITGWRFHHPLPRWIAAQVVGVLLICAGLVPVIHAFVQFAKAGGTPMPIAPTQHLVVTGFNRYVRNPMYLGLLTVLAGEALLFGQFVLLLYAAAMWVLTASFVRWYEEPTLARQFGAEYELYRRAVPAWRVRLRPWTA
jgi:protein-S-isoprenylcysteine O-methyltransferase Ste14